MTREEMQRSAQLGVGRPVEPAAAARTPMELGRDESSGGKLGEVIRTLSDSPGATPLWAAWRSGLKDLQSLALDPFPDGFPSVQKDEMGSIANPTVAAVDREVTGRRIEVDMDMDR